MKIKVNNNLSTLTIGLTTMLCCWNGSVVNNTPSSQDSTAPDVNFYGILEDHTHTADIESILIGSKYESIPVYQQIQMHPDREKSDTKKIVDIDPKQNKTLVNLQDIKSICLQHPNNPIASSVEINGKTYIQIIIESLHGTKKHYLVESTRKITCKEIDKSAEISEKPTLQNRDINFIHVKKLTIKGFRSNTDYKAAQIDLISQDENRSSQKKLHPASTDQAKKEFQNNASDLLHAIEENVKNMPIDNPSAFETMRSTILTLLKSLRDQLQKFLDMIK